MHIRDQILNAALPQIVFDGWSEGVLSRAALAAGLGPLAAKRAFPKPIDAIDYSSARADAEMIETLRRDYSLPTMKIRERIATAVMVRFRQQAAHREAVRRALGVYALPWNTPRAVAALYATVDAIWREAGDTSTDYNFYTKRLLLSQVYTTTLRVWLDDHSPDLADTEAFLRRRIEDVMTIEKLKARARDGLGKVEHWLPKRWA
ncbi:MAG: COQ9 family protein [Rickettsiales bacterium]